MKFNLVQKIDMNTVSLIIKSSDFIVIWNITKLNNGLSQPQALHFHKLMQSFLQFHIRLIYYIMQPLLTNNFEINTSRLRYSVLGLSIKAMSHYPVVELMRKWTPELLTHSYLKKNHKQLSKTVFEFQITTAQQRWRIQKRIEDFVELEKVLRTKYGKLIMFLPLRRQQDIESAELVMGFLDMFLNNLAKNAEVMADSSFMLFLELPSTNERRRLKKYRQIFMNKKSGGRHNQTGCRKCTSVFGGWRQRLFTITSEGVFYSEGSQVEQSQIKEMIAYSIHFELDYDEDETYGIRINSCQRNLELKASSSFDFVLFIQGIKLSLDENNYLNVKRFDSFADVRKNCDSRFFIDGQDYFESICTKLLQAQKEVFIADWMLSPQFVLIRPANMDTEYRLDRVLLKIAKRGVKVYIIVYQEPKLALSNDSEHTKSALEALHANIKVLRHPNYLVIPFLWSHHEKILIIDQKYGYLGGLDICFARMDNKQHRLVDLGEDTKGTLLYFWDGIDYANPRKKDLSTPSAFTSPTIDRSVTPRMPWHDIGVLIVGDSVIDLCRHFVQYWNFVNFQTNFDERELLMQVGISSQRNQADKKSVRLSKKKTIDSEYMPEPFNVQKLIEMDEMSTRDTKLQSFKRPMSHITPAIRAISPSISQDPIRKRNNTTTIKNLNPKFKELCNIAQKNQTLDQQKKYYMQNIQAPKSFLRDIKPLELTLRTLQFLNPFTKNLEGRPNEIVVAGEHFVDNGKQKHQIIRSASTWSLGIEEGKEEKSIYLAYIQLISRAEQFIYIQNQFFMSHENKVVEAIKIKIETAYHEKKRFKVMVMMPLMPGFEGEIYHQNSSVLRVQMHLQYQTICRGGLSLIESLSHVHNLQDYLRFYSLRQHGVINSIPVTEILYIHSKLMIIDDKVALLGSANINDRSLLGTRDSEIGVVIEDGEEFSYKRKEFTITVSKPIHDLRKALYVEHFGLTEQEAVDPVSQDLWELISKRAKTNTEIYRTLFACYPDDKAKTLEDLKLFQKTANPRLYGELRKQIVGQVVEFPLEFMRDQDLDLKANQKEFYVPYINFT